MKSVIKEIFIILLLIVAVTSALGIIFYEYNPMNKNVPKEVEAYTIPEKVQEELDETLEASQTQNIIKTYRIDASDLRGFERSNDYDKGKINPFDKIGSDGTRTETNISEGELSEGESSGRPSNTSQGKFGVDGNK